MSKAGKRSPAINKAIKSNVPGPDAHKKLTLSDKQKDEAKMEPAKQVEAELRSKAVKQKTLFEQLQDQRKEYIRLRDRAVPTIAALSIRHCSSIATLRSLLGYWFIICVGVALKVSVERP